MGDYSGLPKSVFAEIKKDLSFLIVVLTVLAFSFILTGCKVPRFSQAAAAKNPVEEVVYTLPVTPLPDQKKLPDQEPVTIEISLVGDIMVHQSQLNAAFDKKMGQYDFSGYFQEVKDCLQKADLTIGNLETTVAGEKRGYSGYPVFNSPAEVIMVLKDAGFDVLTNANNHSMDRGASGVLATIQQLDQVGLKHTGTSASPEDRSNYLVLEIKGIKLAILAYSYGTNGIPVPQGQSYLVNLINIPEIEADIRNVRALGADVVLVSPHFGAEYARVPGSKEEALAEQIFAAGADIVAGSHPHVLQPMVRRGLHEEKGMFLAYSLGNFISAQRGGFKDSGVILNLTLQKDPATGRVSLTKAGYIPTWVQIAYQKGKKIYRVVAVERAINHYRQGIDPTIRQRDYERLLQVWEDTTKVLSGPAAPVLQHVEG